MSKSMVREWTATSRLDESGWIVVLRFGCIDDDCFKLDDVGCLSRFGMSWGFPERATSIMPRRRPRKALSRKIHIFYGAPLEWKSVPLHIRRLATEKLNEGGNLMAGSGL
ncbi:unnamed protein product [Symbiodinium natans]|uniref:Uncharacterized protein n=1 Tax=Symbiodinium natans TaxID=878477 RepID=A0A812TY54_9DINO|nr:unnamed protein product [Symbiodinium natans]